jgi:hypothetical protein
MTTTKKITKKSMYATVLDILADAESRGFALPEGMDFGALSDFVNHEIELLDKKAESAAKRAADKKVAGDALRDRIYGVLSDTDFKTTNEIVSALGDPDVSSQMVTARLTQLINLEQVEKDSVTIPASGEGGKSRKVVAYRKLA